MFPRAHSNTNNKRHIDWFRTDYGSVAILGNGPPAFPLKLPLPIRDHNPIYSDTWFLELTRVLNPKVISIASAVFAKLMAHRPYTVQRAALPIKIHHSYGGP